MIRALIQPNVDFRDVDQFESGDKGLEYHAALDCAASQSVPYLKVACVTIDPVVETHCWQYIVLSKALGSNWQFAVFAEFEQARQWVEN